MLSIDHEAIARRLRLDNPWWSGPFDDLSAHWPRRAYYRALTDLVRQPVHRAVVLLGARRVGKTTLLRQIIADASQANDLTSTEALQPSAPGSTKPCD
jgi:hypothetical protein